MLKIWNISWDAHKWVTIFFFWWIKRQYINEKRHFKEAPLSIQEVYKKTFTHGLSNQQNLQLKWDQKQKDPWTTPTDYKVKPIYTPETYALHSQKPYCFFPSKQSIKFTETTIGFIMFTRFKCQMKLSTPMI